MTQGQEDYMRMSNVTLGVMADNNDIWKDDTTTSGKVTNATTTITEIELLEKQHGLNATGTTKTKNTLWGECAAEADHIDSGLIAYYEDKDDQTNLAIIKFTISNYTHGAFADGLKKMQLVQATAAGMPIANLTPYKVTATDITTLAANLILLKDAAPANRLMVVTNAAITAAINDKFTILKPQMNKLDTSINTYKRDQSEFVSKYYIGRKIISYGKGHTTAEVNLMPVEFEALLGNKYTIGDVMTIRNHSNLTLHFGYTDTPGVLPTEMESLASKSEVKVTIAKNAQNTYGHWLIVHNPNQFDDVSVTVLLAKG